MLRLRSHSLIHGDETTVQGVEGKDKGSDQHVVHVGSSQQREDSDEPIARLPARLRQIHPQTFLGDYDGILVTDGYTARRTLYGATHVGCMAHSRRRFVEALKTRKNGGGTAGAGAPFFEQLY